MRNDSERGVRFEAIGKKSIEVVFDGERRSSDGGATLLAAIDRRLGLTARLAAMLVDSRAESRIEHSYLTMFRQRVFAIALGYADQNDSARIGTDPVLKLVCGPTVTDDGALASQPTLSRFEHAPEGRELVALSRTLEDQVLSSLSRRHRRARQITIDLDGSEDPTHGQQPFSFFNGYYESWCYLPLFGFISVDGESEQHLFHARLRPGTVKEVRCSLALLRRIVPELKRRFRRARILIRLDAGFAHPRLFELLDELDVDYLVAVGSNPVLDGLAESRMRASRVLAERFGMSVQLFGEGQYRAKTWPNARRVIFKAEVVCLGERTPRDNARFVVTNLRRSPERLWQLYRARGDVENRIKELHHGLEIDRTSCTSFLANQFRVLETAAAFVLLQALRGEPRNTELARAQVTTLRERLFKIGATVKESCRRIVLSLPRSYPWIDVWRRAALAVGATPS